jgi:hypothetical protein
MRRKMYGAEKRTRTSTEFPPQVPETCVSTYFTISAWSSDFFQNLDKRPISMKKFPRKAPLLLCKRRFFAHFFYDLVSFLKVLKEVYFVYLP